MTGPEAGLTAPKLLVDGMPHDTILKSTLVGRSTTWQCKENSPLREIFNTPIDCERVIVITANTVVQIARLPVSSWLDDPELCINENPARRHSLIVTTVNTAEL
jgi:hypothetical protein